METNWIARQWWIVEVVLCLIDVDAAWSVLVSPTRRVEVVTGLRANVTKVLCVL